MGLGLRFAEGAHSFPRSSRWFEGLDRFQQVCAGLMVSQLILVFCSVTALRSSSLQNREGREGGDIVTKGVGASLLLLAFEAVFACSVGVRNQRHFLEYFENGIWQTCRAWSSLLPSPHPSHPRSARTVVYSACFSNTWQWAGVAAVFAIPSVPYQVRGMGLWTSWVLPIGTWHFAFAVLSLHKAGETASDYWQRLGGD